MAIRFEVIPVTNFMQNCTLVWCDQTDQAALVDPGGELDVLLSRIEELGLTLSAVWLTHGHIDHVGAAAQIAAQTGVHIFGPQKEDLFLLSNLENQAARFGFKGEFGSFVPDQWLGEGDSLSLGNEKFLVKHIFGHTPGHVVFYHAASNLLISGDVLFRNSVGRTDFEKGSSEDLLRNIKEKLLILPDETTVIAGHGALTTIGAEKKSNPFLKNLI